MDAVPRVTQPTLTLAKPWPGAFSQHPLGTTLTHTLTHTHTPPAMGMPASGWLSSPLPAPSHASWECDSRGLPRAQEEELGLHTSWGPRRQRGQVGEALLCGGRFWLGIRGTCWQSRAANSRVGCLRGVARSSCAEVCEPGQDDYRSEALRDGVCESHGRGTSN